MSNNASHFGFGLKNTTTFRSIIYRGTSGEVHGLKYKTTSLDNPAWRVGVAGSGYFVGDKVSVKVYFEGANISWKVGVNDVWQPLRNATKSFNLVSSLSSLSPYIQSSERTNSCVSGVTQAVIRVTLYF